MAAQRTIEFETSADEEAQRVREELAAEPAR